VRHGGLHDAARRGVSVARCQVYDDRHGKEAANLGPIRPAPGPDLAADARTASAVFGYPSTCEQSVDDPAPGAAAGRGEWLPGRGFAPAERVRARAQDGCRGTHAAD